MITDAGWSASYNSGTSCSSCPGTTNLTNSSGTFSDGSGSSDYCNNADCSWLIQPTGATAITLSFSSFSTENTYDLVNVYDGASTSDALLGSFSGSTIPASVTSSGGTMLVRFTSDYSNTASGWNASYTSSNEPSCPYCFGTTALTDASGSFSDGSGTDNYCNNSNCMWLIQPENASSITLSFSSFATENNYDYFLVYDGPTNMDPLIGSYTGSSIPASITSTGGSMLVQFTSDGTYTAAGWEASYNSNSSCSSCSGTTNLTNSSGVFSDGSGSENYCNNSNCKWLIQPAGASSITLSFSAFATEYNYDYVYVYDGSTTSDPLIGSFTGSTIPSSITSSGGSLLVQFYSDNTYNDAGWDASYTSSSPCSSCSGTTNLTNSSGTFSDGSGSNDYCNNANCMWLIQPDNANSITLSFSSFATEYNYDYVYVFDGATTSDPLIGSFSGSNIPASLTSSGGSMLVEFVTDYSNTAAGWNASYTGGETCPNCFGTSILTDASGSLSDGSGTADYCNNSNCMWLIQPENASSITLSFASFSTESNYDYVFVYDGPTNTDPLIGSFSGSNIPASLTSSGGSMLVQFTSDNTYTGAGWSASYTSIPISTCPHCSGTTVLTDESGTFSDGSGADDYCDYANCLWLIQPSASNSITLTFSSLSTESNYDFVNVYDGSTINAPLLGSYSGSSIPASITSSSGSMLVQFLTDFSNTAAGWSASYTSTAISTCSYCNGSTILTDPSGAFSDGSGTDNYCNNSNCSWLIQPQGATSITLSFSSFAAESGWDYVQVYDGSNTSAALLGSFTGSSIPPTVTSSGGSMLVQFSSDEIINAAGWNASYISTTTSSCPQCIGTTVLSNTTGSFSDGSGTGNYCDNSNCMWLIQPANASTISLTFTSFSTESNYDYVNVYDGSTTTDPLIGSFTGSDIPASISSSGGSMLVQFTSDNSVTKSGWSASYSSATISTCPHCSGTSVLSNTSGTFSDGSGINNYCNNSNCSWLIQPAGASFITLSFSSFSTESNYDYVFVYDGSTSSAPLIGSYSGSTIPASITSSGGSMFVEFISDNTVTSGGWNASYTSNSVVSCPYCFGTTPLTDAAGSFSDGSGTESYCNNSNCMWLIQPENASSITLSFASFSTENNFDYVNVYDGPTNTDPLIGSFTGSNLPASVTSSGGSMLVQFTSDNTNTDAGWSASYTSNPVSTCPHCSETTVLTHASGTFSDGSGNDDYCNNSNCMWLIQPSGSNIITLSFLSLSTESNYDFVNVYDGSTTNAPLLGSYSGTSVPASVTSSSGSMLVQFTTDFSNTAAGWSASYSCTPVSLCPYCTGSTILTDASGSFSDGSGSDNYCNNSNCSWLIQPPGATSIALSFSSFATENGWDYVQVYDGSNTSAALLGSFTGSNVPATVTSSGGSMLVQFSSDAIINAAGWNASYTSTTTSSCPYCSGSTVLTNATGSFSDGSGIDNYCDNSNCSWLIQPADASTISLTFSSFSTENNYDFVNVYDGSTTGDPLIGSFTGSSIPASITSSGGSMLVQFTSDNTNTESGWSASYSSTTVSSCPYCSGTTILSNSVGSFSDGSGSENYCNNSNCTWLIQPDGAIAITLSFSSFSTESDHDYVNVYDGASTAAPLLGSFTGSTVPESITSNGGSMLVQFTSDNAINSIGWKASYTACFIPSQPVRILGKNNICQGTNQTYRISSIPNATSYTWKIPDGWIGASTSDTISVLPDSNSGSITVTANNSCGSSLATSLSIAVTSTPGQPGKISGETKVSEGSTQTYRVSPEAGATSYTWYIPDGWTGSSSTEALIVVIGANSGTISVTANNSNGPSLPSSLIISVNPTPAQPADISGNTKVCRGSGQTYTITPVSGATSYTWSLPGDWSGSSLSDSIIVIAGSTNGTISVTANNSNGSSLPTSLNVSVTATPSQPGIISGDTVVCHNVSYTYIVPAVSEATSYTWTIPDGWSGSATSNSITLLAGTNSGSLSVAATNSCGSSQDTSLSISVITIPVQPGIIMGDTMVCPASAQYYSLTPVAGSTSYTWSIPDGWSGASSLNTITVTSGTESGLLSVRANNACGSSPDATLHVLVITAPPQPGPISGDTAVCSGSDQSYSVTPISGAISYSWTLPEGWSGSSPLNTIHVVIGESGGSILVKANNSCTSGLDKSQFISVATTPSKPGIIEGDTLVCPGSNQTYGVSSVSGATSYTWTIPDGWTGASTLNTIEILTGLNSGSISVRTNNFCFSSADTSISISVKPYSSFTGSIEGDTLVCEASSQTYGVLPVPGAISYSWTIPADWSGNSASNTIPVLIGKNSGSVSVTVNNSCDIVATTSILVDVISIPLKPIITLDGNTLSSNADNGNQWYNLFGPISGANNQQYIINSNGDYYVIVTNKGCSSVPSDTAILTAVNTFDDGNTVTLYPNPVVDQLIIHFEKLFEGNISLFDLFGRQLIQVNRNGIQFNIDMSQLPSGIYLVKIQSKSLPKLFEIIKNNR